MILAALQASRAEMVLNKKYEKALILGDFNAGIEEKHMKCFCDNYNLKSLVKQPTYY